MSYKIGDAYASVVSMVCEYSISYIIHDSRPEMSVRPETQKPGSDNCARTALRRIRPKCWIVSASRLDSELPTLLLLVLSPFLPRGLSVAALPRTCPDATS